MQIPDLPSGMQGIVVICVLAVAGGEPTRKPVQTDAKPRTITVTQEGTDAG